MRRRRKMCVRDSYPAGRGRVEMQRGAMQHQLEAEKASSKDINERRAFPCMAITFPRSPRRMCVCSPCWNSPSLLLIWLAKKKIKMFEAIDLGDAFPLADAGSPRWREARSIQSNQRQGERRKRECVAKLNRKRRKKEREEFFRALTH